MVKAFNIKNFFLNMRRRLILKDRLNEQRGFFNISADQPPALSLISTEVKWMRDKPETVYMHPDKTWAFVERRQKASLILSVEPGRRTSFFS